MPDPEKIIADLKQKLQNLEALRGVLDDKAFANAKSALEAQLHAEGGIFNGPITAQGDVVGRDQYKIFIANSARDILRLLPELKLSPEALQAAAEAYLLYIYDRHCFLNLKGMGPSDRFALKLPLLDLYVPLKARLTLPEGETWRRDLKLAGRRLSEEDQEALVGRLGEPQPALELLQKHDGLIILGDPGAGKTTFLKVLSLRLALGQGDDLSLGRRLPVLAPLSAYANALTEGDVRLDDFIANYFHNIGADLPIAAILTEAFKKGQALILLDGLDEVKDPAQRHTVVERVVDFFTLHRRAGNKFVLTSRIVGYREVRPTAPELGECTLIDFEQGEIADFIARWTQTIEKQASGEESTVARSDAEREQRELLDAIRHNPGVRHLAANPLLLTILALMKRQGVTLPERRVELYDQYVRTMLSSWNRTRGLGRPPSRELDVVQTMRTLAPLALWMHETNPGAGLVKREALRRHLEEIFTAQGTDDPPSAARRFLADVREHAGLLLERGPGEYGFIHLTFEEYLAAVAIALRGQGDCRPIVDYLGAHVGDAAWREVSLLTVPYLGIIQQLDRVAGAVVEALTAEQPGDPGAAVTLAGQAVLDAGETGVPVQARQAVTGALVATMQSAAVAPILRREAGLILGNLGWRPPDLDAFVEIPAGPFLYGDDKETREIPHPYWIAQYPVTNAQYARFVKDEGYHRREFWSEEGWAWREKQPRDQLGYWSSAFSKNPIVPVANVNHYEAVAYCNWLTQQLRLSPNQFGAINIQPPSLIRSLADSPFLVRLPSEVEWERAARGVDGREYPWGNTFEQWRANTGENEPERNLGIGTMAVCTYLQGVSPVGAWDMSGNVWEWTSSLYESDSEIIVLRGGSWDDDPRNARCAYRLRLFPDFFINILGFRVIVSLVIPEF